MKSIALGQYYPSNSVLHRLDPRIKILLAILYIVCSFLCKNALSFAILALSSLVIILLGKIPYRIIAGGIKPVLIILIFTAVINIFWTTGQTPLVSWKFINIYLEGIYSAIFIIVRITSLIIGTSLFMTYTTTPIELTDGIEDLLSPLKKLHVPVHDFAMMMTIALRFIPTLIEETDKIMTAQKARGADFSSGSLIDRAKALIPVLIPLFVSSFNRAADLATAMECRCYHGGEGKTRMKIRHISVKDIIALILVVALGAVILLANVLNIPYALG